MIRQTLIICVAVSLLFTAQSQTMQEQQNSAEVEVLQAQLEIMENYNERLLATVYWSLGGIVTVVILVAGFGWFANFRLYERDKKSLQQELSHTLSLELSKAHHDLRKSSDEYIQKTLKSKLLRIDRDIKMIRVEQLRTEAEVWEEKGIKANALMTYISMLTEAIEVDNLYVVSDTLDKVRELLLSKITQIDAQLVADFNTVLNKLPSEYESEVQDLKQLLRTARE